MDKEKLYKLLHSYNIDDFSIGLNLAYNSMSKEEFRNMVAKYRAKGKSGDRIFAHFIAHGILYRRHHGAMWITSLPLEYLNKTHSTEIKLE